MNGACAVRGGIPVRMLEIKPEQANAYDGDVILPNPYSLTTYANDVTFLKFDAGTTAILNIGCASYSRGNYTPEKAERKRRSAFVCF